MITVRNKHHGWPIENYLCANGPRIYIGRGSPLGNPFSHMPGTSAEFQVSSREEAIARYETWLRERIETNDARICAALNTIGHREMDGLETNLICFCAPKACHGDVIKRIIKEHL